VSRVYVFADEGGDFAFKRGQGSSRYFIIGTATMPHCDIGTKLIDLRRELAWNGLALEQFHAASDKQRVRDRVFDVIARSGVRIDATILDKTKTQDHLRADPLRFYKEAWFLHFKYVAQRVAASLDELFVVTSSLQIRRKRQAIHWAVQDVVRQVSPTAVFHTAFWSATSDPCLQVADYGTWAIQRKYEMGDPRSYDLINHLVKSAFEPFKFGPTTYY
jgi:hypothetical protein